MNSFTKGKESVHSGTGVFYQAIPAVGADGKNIMKLIPVQMVNGRFFQTDANKPRACSTNQRAVTTSGAPDVEKRLSPASATSRHVELDHGYSRSELPPQRQAARPPGQASPVAVPAARCERSVRRPRQLRPTAAHAPVQTVPAHERSHVAPKKPAFNAPDEPSTGSHSPSVTRVSPPANVNQDVTPPTGSALRLFTDTLIKGKCGSRSKGSRPHLKLIPKAPQRPNSPIKWVIEEEESLGRDCDAVRTRSFGSPTVPRAVAHRETSHGGVTEKSRSVQGKSGRGREDAQVVCSGKVFYLSKKCPSDPPTSVTQRCTSTQSAAPPPQQSGERTDTRQDVRIIIPDESDDVIDLCDEEDSTAWLDEDNVIFVSYIPPTSGSADDAMPQTRTDETSGTKDRSGGEDVGRGPAQRGQRVLLPAVRNVPRVTNMHRDSDIRSLQSNSRSSRGTSQKDRDMEEMHSSPNPAARPTPDRVLRQMFGVTADVRIRLQRLEETSVWAPLMEPVRRRQDATSPVRDLDESCESHNSDPAAPTSRTHVRIDDACRYGAPRGRAPDVGYVEPIDEDLSSADESEVLAAARTQTCVDVNTKTRLGRTRKRTTCPCCTPGTQRPAVKSTVRLEEAERAAEQTSKKEGRTKAPGKDGTPSGKVNCLRAKHKHKSRTEVAAGSTLPTLPTEQSNKTPGTL